MTKNMKIGDFLGVSAHSSSGWRLEWAGLWGPISVGMLNFKHLQCTRDAQNSLGMIGREHWRQGVFRRDSRVESRLTSVISRAILESLKAY